MSGRAGAMTVRRLPPDVLQQLKIRGAANNRSMEAEARAVLTQHVANAPGAPLIATPAHWGGVSATMMLLELLAIRLYEHDCSSKQGTERITSWLALPEQEREFFRAIVRTAKTLKSLYEPPAYEFTEETCAGHVASADPKVCARCGTHIDSLRPPDDEDGAGEGL